MKLMQKLKKYHDQHHTQHGLMLQKRYGHEGAMLWGANIAGFEKVADAMMAQGNLLI